MVADWPGVKFTLLEAPGLIEEAEVAGLGVGGLLPVFEV
jgi:hypothetical protein